MTDMRPNRGAMMIQILQLFVREFFDQNPLSHLSIMMLRNGRAERLTDLSGSPVSLLLLCGSQLCLFLLHSCRTVICSVQLMLLLPVGPTGNSISCVASWMTAFKH